MITAFLAVMIFPGTFFLNYSINTEYWFLIFQLLQPEADKVNFHFIAFVNVNGQLYEFGKHFWLTMWIPVCVLMSWIPDCHIFFFFRWENERTSEARSYQRWVIYNGG